MGSVFDPELYRATEKHFAPIKMPEWSKHSFQTWHTDAVFDNGYYATAMFSFTGPLHAVLLQIVDASGAIVVESMVFLEDEEVSYSTDGYDINLGENYFRSHFPNLVIHIRDDENKAGADLLVEFLIMPTISELPDGIGIGRAKTPNMPIQVAWFFMPWNKITGTLIDKSFVRILEAAYTLDPVRTFGAEPFVSPFGSEPASSAQAQSAESEVVVEEKAAFIDESIISKFSIKSKLGKVMKDPDGLAVLEKFVPGISKDPNTRLGYGMTLKMLFSMPQTGVSKAVLAKIDQALREIK
jgi:hypothetical protein